MEERDNVDNSVNYIQWLNDNLRSSLFVKLCFIGIILLLCQIPMIMISELTEHRQGLAEDVEREVASKWGFKQKISGPLIAIPISYQRAEQLKDGDIRQFTESATLFVVPDSLKVTATMEPEVRYRGIYEVMLYRSQIVMEGVFSQELAISEDYKPEYDNASIFLGISEMIGLSNVKIESDCSENKGYPGIYAPGVPFDSGIDIPIQLSKDRIKSANPLRFKASFSLNGCRNLSVTPLGKITTIEMSSTWSTPSFDGDFLPARREINAKGFKASWEINEFNRNIPPSWRSCKERMPKPVAGVSLLKPANIYTQVTRAATYSILIFLIVLMAFLIAEKVTQTWMHPLQYCLAALSLVLFYALTLALSEHIAFSLSYWLSAVAIAGLCVFYCALIFRKKSAVLGMGTAVLASYAVIFVLLRMEDYALLAGTLLVFVLLAILMGMTGRINQQS